MPIETEIKIKLSDVSEFRGRLKALGALLLSARHFEDNHVLDFPDGRLRSRKCLMRIRITDSAAWVTFKGPPLPDDVFKKRDEWETSVTDGSLLLRILIESGMTVWFRYQKRREEYKLTATGGAPALHVALDETPIGDYAEIEGIEEGILWAAARLDLDPSEFIQDSYYYLYLEHCRRRGITAGDMVFREYQQQGTD